MPIIVIAEGKSLKTYALLDSGSNITVLHDSVTNALGVKGNISSCTITTIHGDRDVPCQEVSFSISSLDCKAQFAVEKGISLQHPDMPRRSFNPSVLKSNWPHLVDLNFDSRNTVRATCIIGRDIKRHLMSSKCVTLPKDRTALVPRELSSVVLLLAKFLFRPHLLFSRLVSPSTRHKTVSMSWSENPLS